MVGSWQRDLLSFGDLLHPSESNHGGRERRSRACHFRSRDYVSDKTGFKTIFKVGVGPQSIQMVLAPFILKTLFIIR